MSKGQTSKELMTLWNPHLVREAAAFAIKMPQEQMTPIMEQATDFLETLPWQGTKAYKHQELSWPRKGVVLKDGTLISSDEIPEALKECCIKVSYFIAAGIPFDVPALTHVMLTIGHFLIPDANVKIENLTSWNQPIH